MPRAGSLAETNPPTPTIPPYEPVAKRQARGPPCALLLGRRSQLLPLQAGEVRPEGRWGSPLSRTTQDRSARLATGPLTQPDHRSPRAASPRHSAKRAEIRRTRGAFHR